MSIAMANTKVMNNVIYGVIKSETVENFFKRGGIVTKVEKLKRGRKSKILQAIITAKFSKFKKFTTNRNKAAWDIRKNAAIRFCCPVMEISWAACLELVN